MLCLPLDRVYGFLLGINPYQAREEARDRLVRYQRECYRVLAGAFDNRTRPNSRMRTSLKTVAALQQIREDMLDVVRWADEEIERMSR
jgi:hypothetical protein